MLPSGGQFLGVHAFSKMNGKVPDLRWLAFPLKRDGKVVGAIGRPRWFPATVIMAVAGAGAAAFLIRPGTRADLQEGERLSVTFIILALTLAAPKGMARTRTSLICMRSRTLEKKRSKSNSDYECPSVLPAKKTLQPAHEDIWGGARGVRDCGKVAPEFVDRTNRIKEESRANGRHLCEQVLASSNLVGGATSTANSVPGRSPDNGRRGERAARTAGVAGERSARPRRGSDRHRLGILGMIS